MAILQTIFLFVLAGLAEISGAYLVWQWRNGGKPVWFALAGMLVLFLYSFIQTAQSFSFGRAFAAYGGVFIAMATLWAYTVDGWRPDHFDMLGVGIALIGVTVIIWGRNWF